MDSYELREAYSKPLDLMGLCLECRELFRADLSSAYEPEDFCSASHEETWNNFLGTL